jgi:hypothetical protein
LHGFWAVQLGNVFFYVREARHKETIETYARDIKNERWDRWIALHSRAAHATRGTPAVAHDAGSAEIGRCSGKARVG